MRMVVVLPEPFGPRMPKISPGRISNETPATAVSAPKRLVSSRTETAEASPEGSAAPLAAGAASAGIMLAARAPGPPRLWHGRREHQLLRPAPRRGELRARGVRRPLGGRDLLAAVSLLEQRDLARGLVAPRDRLVARGDRTVHVGLRGDVALVERLDAPRLDLGEPGLG